MKSIIQKEKRCWYCGSPYVHDHHIFGGPNRPLSEKYGLKVWLCVAHHTGPFGVHNQPDMMQELRQIGQKAFEKRYPDQDFLAIFRKNYDEESL